MAPARRSGSAPVVTASGGSQAAHGTRDGGTIRLTEAGSGRLPAAFFVELEHGFR